MKLGSYQIPEKRLIEDAINDIRRIYDAIQSGEISSSDLSSMFGYKYGTEPTFRKRLNSLLAYGLLEGKGKFSVTQLGKDIAYPEGETHEIKSVAKAFMNIGLWKELYSRYKDKIPKENFWVVIKNITGVEPQEERKYQSLIQKWYFEDVSYVVDAAADEIKMINENESSLITTLSEEESLLKQQQAIIGDSNKEIEKFLLGKSAIMLPKENMKKEWEKIKRIVDIYLETDDPINQNNDSV